MIGTTLGQYQILLALALLLAPALAAHQTPAAQTPTQSEPQTRAEVLRREREAKLQELTPQVPDAIEQRILALENPEARGLMDANFRGFYPRAQFVSRGSGIGLWTRFWQPDIGNRRLDIAGSAFYTLEQYQYYDLQIGRPMRTSHCRCSRGRATTSTSSLTRGWPAATS